MEIKFQLDATDEFLLQILLLAQHVSGTTMPIIRSSTVLYRWLLPVVFGAWFSSCRYGVELRVVCLIACSTCFGHHYAHHQELESIIQVVAACGVWCFGFKVVGMVWSWGLCVRFAGCCSSSILLLVANGHQKCIKCTKADVRLRTPDDGQKGCPKRVE